MPEDRECERDSPSIAPKITGGAGGQGTGPSSALTKKSEIP